MTDDQLVARWRGGEPIALPFFDGAAAELFFEDEEEVRRAGDAFRRFLSLGTAERDSASRHLHASFGEAVMDAGWDWIDPAMRAVAPESAEIWRFVRPTTIGAMRSWDVGDRDRERLFVVVEANCGWEEEHGLLLSWRDGADLVRVSDYDGHATNGHAHDDLSKDAFVHCSRRADLCTS